MTYNQLYKYLFKKLNEIDGLNVNTIGQNTSNVIPINSVISENNVSLNLYFTINNITNITFVYVSLSNIKGINLVNFYSTNSTIYVDIPKIKLEIRKDKISLIKNNI